MTWAALTMEVNDWADENSDIVDLVSAGKSELGRDLWVVRLSDWSMETKPNGSSKEIVYIDGGHHGNEYLGTALAWLSAKWYINGWNDGNEKPSAFSKTTNFTSSYAQPRWKRHRHTVEHQSGRPQSKYDHYWNTCPTTQPGSRPSARLKRRQTLISTLMSRTPTSCTMHTGVWIILYPWGKWPEQPPDWELFWTIRDTVNAGISDIPIQNANQGLYPNCGTSRDYGYGQMGFPTFTFETDDEQFVPGSFENINDRLAEEMDVMRYLIENVWYWRARLVNPSPLKREPHP